MNIVNFTPIESLTGGLIIGFAVSMLYLLRGNYSGISGIYFNVISANGRGFIWRSFFIIGLIVGPVILSFFQYKNLGFEMPVTNPLFIILGGLFVGIIFITEPGFSSLNLYYIYPIIFCLGLSYVAIAIRKLSSTEPAWLISFFFSFSIMLLSFLSFYQGWILPSLLDLFLLSMVGILGGLANLWLSVSYKYSEVSLVSPLKYLALVFAIIFGYFIWNEIPTTKTLLGALLVIFSSIIIFRREMYLKKKLSVSRHE